MIINPIYFNLGSDSSGDGENDWDPTDVKENKEMLDLTNYTPLNIEINTTYPIIKQLNGSDFKSNNTTLILQFILTSAETNENFNMLACTNNSLTAGEAILGVVNGSKILFSVIVNTNYYYKIRLPEIYNNYYIRFSNKYSSTSISTNINAWYKNN